MKGLTAQQNRVRAALEAQLRQGNPNIKRLGAELGIADTTIREHLRALARKGFLHYQSRGRGQQPQLRLLQSGVPLVGHITAGHLSEALESPEGYLRLPAYPGKFGLRVEGSSMADVILHRDVVLLEKRSHKSGDICAVRVNGNDATLKYLDLHTSQPGTVRLRPHNPDYPTLEVAAKQVVVDGVFTGLLRGEVIGDLMQGEPDVS